MSECNIEASEGSQITDPTPSVTTPERRGHARSQASAPRSIEETGLPAIFIGRLVLKSTWLNGKSSFADLSSRHCLSVAVLEDILAFLVRERLAEITHRGATDIDVHFRLTEAGRIVAKEAMERCSYCGPAPVSYQQYVYAVEQHSVRRQRIRQQQVQEKFAGLCIDSSLLDAAAASLNAGKPLMLYGPAGSGKTFIAERLGQLLQGDVPVPYAIYVGGEIVQLYDPLLHHDAQDAETLIADKRWRLCRRPVVLSGGELTLDALDLRYDPAAGFYQAPPHMKANMGLYVVDDLGRQRVDAQALLNRWIMPLDRSVDLFTLQSGMRFSAPFDVWPVFSTNLDPAAIGDEAFLRRLGSKLFVGPMAIDHYHAVFDACSTSFGLHTTDAAFAYLLDELHGASGKPLMACYPRDLLSLVSASAEYRNTPREVTPQALLEAWHAYFGSNAQLGGTHPFTSSARKAGRRLAAG
ncbi:ATP-binding protein [Trinickia caryophylli]|uniref:AAA+ ATPase domain-containing protein n=1 Tax=Trinickia caryophylli TaxID=28094 RepID=A0A1X7CXC9_TRICW|nr:ATPase [Trinickia caryophylli]PMS13442.1 ATPase [Trinickia caryophylli]TRX13701.1 ATP-binding protein [Trinickia caryophylli]WQE15287.1 ATP-binding protein [Trinickia caryophylli]SMF04497.1 hypothetical protein SAMN06295900_10284 [Trinickia caryophylli]GLU30961.1 hypothetical protein Busp01_08030 [Trinickia caryophylli]